ncbi:MAG TPA: YfdX family protein [Rugosibacter sp.]
MKFKKLAVPAIVLAMASSMIGYSTLTQAADKAKTPIGSLATKLSPEDQALMKFSESGSSAMRAIQAARIAIFNGDTKLAMEKMTLSKTFMDQAEKEAPKFDTVSTMMVGGKAVGATSSMNEVKRVPVDGRLILADNFVLTPEKKVHIDKANEYFKKGKHAEAVEELRQGEIDVSFTRTWMPIKQSKKHLDQAIKLDKEGKYYEANLALKAIEDGLSVDSVSLLGLPGNVSK